MGGDRGVNEGMVAGAPCRLMRAGKRRFRRPPLRRPEEMCRSKRSLRRLSLRRSRRPRLAGLFDAVWTVRRALPQRMAKRSPHQRRSQRARHGATPTTGDGPGVRHATDARTAGPAQPRPPAMGQAYAAPLTLEVAGKGPAQPTHFAGPAAQHDPDHRRWARRPPVPRPSSCKAHRSVTTDAGPGLRHGTDDRSAGPSQRYHRRWARSSPRRRRSKRGPIAPHTRRAPQDNDRAGAATP